MKKLLAIFTMTSVLAFGLAACSEGGRKTGDVNNKFDELTTTEAVYGFSAASAGMLISSMNNPGNAKRLAAEKGIDSVVEENTFLKAEISLSSGVDGEKQNSESSGNVTEPERPSGSAAEPEADLSEFDEYMALVESLLSDGGFKIQSQTSDRPEFEEKMVVGYNDMVGNSLQYIMYYNQILTDVEEDDGEKEEKYRIEGVMNIDGTDYEIFGQKEDESDGGESESETEFRVILGENKYMSVEQSFETEDGETEQEYSYSVIENKKVLERSSFEYEEERGELELKMVSYKNGKTQVVYFEKEKVKGEEVIYLRVGQGADTRRYIAHVKTDANGNSYYEYELV